MIAGMRSFLDRVRLTLRDLYKTSRAYNAAAWAEVERERRGTDIVVEDTRRHAREAADWLIRAQDATPDGGVSRAFGVGWNRFLDLKGWQPSYPETTGYIVPTLLDAATYLEEDDLHRRALQMADWEIDVQMASGAVMGGVLNDAPTPAVFNTGQVMLGWLRAYQETGQERYLEASGRAARFLVEMQSDDGAWRKGNSQYASASSTTYNARVGWALIAHGRCSGEEEFSHAGALNLRYTLARQRDNGWFEDNCLSDPLAPLLHTICYAAEGLLGGYDELGESDYLAGARRTVDHLIPQIAEDGEVPGQLDASWLGTVRWNCLTGNAQLAGLCLRLSSITGETTYEGAGRRLLRSLKSTQNCVSPDPGLRGGIKGSYPFDGDYGRFEVLNWATKFYLDALMLQDQPGSAV